MQTRTIVILLLLISACKKDFSPGEFEDDRLVVLAEITAGDSVEIPIGKTLKVGNGNLIRFEKVNDATVTLTEDNKRSWILKPNFSPQYAGNPTSVFTSRKRFISNTTYSINIEHPTMGVVTAETHIPLTPKPIQVDTSFGMYENQHVLAVTITLQDMADKEDLYMIEALKELVKVNCYFYYQGVKYNYNTPQGSSLYEQVKYNSSVKLIRDTIPQNKFIRLNLFTEDANTENVRIDKLTNPFRRIFLPDQSFNGQTYTIRVYIDTRFFTSTDPTQKGRVRLQFKSASPELYNYLVLYEKYKTDFGSVPANQLVSPSGNIDNGMGVFGGSSRRERIWYFDQF